VKVEDMPRVLDCALWEAVSEGLKMTPSRARKVIRRGRVMVGDVVVRDPDARVKPTARVGYVPK